MAQVATSPRPPSRNSFRSPSPLQQQSIRPNSLQQSSRLSRTFDASAIPISSDPTRSDFDLSSPQRALRSARRKSSYETLAQISATKDPSIDSHIPLPTRTRSASAAEQTLESIPDGVPLEIHVKSPGTPNGDGRPMTPTRSISRIPTSVVGNARALAEETRPRSISPLLPLAEDINPLDAINGNPRSASLSPNTPNTPGGSSAFKRLSLIGPGGTSKVLSELQAAASQARSTLDNTRAQLRLSQRSVGSLTRQVEDLKDGRERLRLENENLNNVVARKERLLQEVLERARKAEAEVVTLKAQVKTEVGNAKKATSTVSEAVTQNQKAQNEYKTLRDSISSMKESWRNEVKELKDEMRKRDEAWKEEVKEVSVKYSSLLKLTKAANAERSKVESLRQENNAMDTRFEAALREEIERLSKEINLSSQATDQATQKAADVSEELARLRRLMRTGATPRHEGG